MVVQYQFLYFFIMVGLVRTENLGEVVCTIVTISRTLSVQVAHVSRICVGPVIFCVRSNLLILVM